MSVEIHKLKNVMHTRQLKTGQLALLTQECRLHHPSGVFEATDTDRIVQRFGDDLQIVGSPRKWVDHFCDTNKEGFACNLLNKGDTIIVKGNQFPER